MCKQFWKGIAASAFMAVLFFTGPAFAQQQSFDPSAFDSSELGLKGAEPVNGVFDAYDIPRVANTAKPSEARWQKIISHKAYAYRDKVEYVRAKALPEKQPWLIRLLDGLFRFFNSSSGKVLLWMVFFAIVGFVAWRILHGQANGIFARRDKRYDLAEDEALLSEAALLTTDWEGLMHQASAAADTRAAVRFGYLCVLQLMHERGLIFYRPDKSNRDYLTELAGKPQHADFRMLTRQYEWAWFGHFLPDEKAMQTFRQTFQNFKQSLGAA